MRKLISSLMAVGALSLAGCATVPHDSNDPVNYSCNSLTFRTHDPQAEVNARANDNIGLGVVAWLLGGARGGNMGAAVQQYGNAQMNSGVAMQNGQVNAGQAWTERIDWCYASIPSPTYDCITLNEPRDKNGNNILEVSELDYPTRAVHLGNLTRRGYGAIYFNAELRGYNGKKLQFGLLVPGTTSYQYFRNDMFINGNSRLMTECIPIDTLLRMNLRGNISVHWNVIWDEKGSRVQAKSYKVLICND
jgi:hypothetical protein